MNNLFSCALDKIEIGIVLVNHQYNIVFCNEHVEKLSGRQLDNFINKKINYLIPQFGKSLFMDSLYTVLFKHNSRFFSSKIHKAFILPESPQGCDIRQNMKIEPLTVDNQAFALIQIHDVTNEVNNERKLLSFISELKKDYLEIKESEKISKELASTDTLTGLYNRNYITGYIDQILKTRTKFDKYALMFLDLDGFKKVNDGYGHTVGDIVLKKVAAILKGSLKQEYATARLGGDEFLSIIKYHDEEDLNSLASELIQKVYIPMKIGANNIQVSASVGIALVEDGIQSPSDIISRADLAMYAAKNLGKNGYCFYNKAGKSFQNINN